MARDKNSDDNQMLIATLFNEADIENKGALGMVQVK